MPALAVFALVHALLVPAGLAEIADVGLGLPLARVQSLEGFILVAVSGFGLDIGKALVAQLVHLFLSFSGSGVVGDAMFLSRVDIFLHSYHKTTPQKMQMQFAAELGQCYAAKMPNLL